MDISSDVTALVDNTCAPSPQRPQTCLAKQKTQVAIRIGAHAARSALYP